MFVVVSVSLSRILFWCFKIFTFSYRFPITIEDSNQLNTHSCVGPIFYVTSVDSSFWAFTLFILFLYRAWIILSNLLLSLSRFLKHLHTSLFFIKSKALIKSLYWLLHNIVKSFVKLTSLLIWIYWSIFNLSTYQVKRFSIYEDTTECWQETERVRSQSLSSSDSDL